MAHTIYKLGFNYKVARPSPGRDVYMSPCPWRAGLYCGPDLGTSARRRRNTQSPPLNSATGCPPAPDSTLTHTHTGYIHNVTEQFSHAAMCERLSETLTEVIR